MIDPALLKPIADELHATLIESNYMDSARSNAAAHLATAKSLGYDKVAPIDILDAEKEIAIPVHNGYHLKNFITGSHLANYDTFQRAHPPALRRFNEESFHLPRHGQRCLSGPQRG